LIKLNLYYNTVCTLYSAVYWTVWHHHYTRSRR